MDELALDVVSLYGVAPDAVPGLLAAVQLPVVGRPVQRRALAAADEIAWNVEREALFLAFSSHLGDEVGPQGIAALRAFVGTQCAACASQDPRVLGHRARLLTLAAIDFVGKAMAPLQQAEDGQGFDALAAPIIQVCPGALSGFRQARASA